jgi:hypothetical protein
MPSAFYSLLVVASCYPGVDEKPGTGYLSPPQGKTTESRPYIPREGDLIFFDDHSPYWTALFAWAGTGAPLHVGMVVKRYNGSLAVLEAGPDDSVWVTIQPVGPRLLQFDKDYQGTITIRPCKKELSAKRSRALTQFAEAQEGKSYAVIRLLLQGTPFRSRGLVGELLWASTELERWSWICSELVVAAGTVAELFPSRVKATATYPNDIVNNKRHDLSKIWDDGEIWRPTRK